MEQRDLIEELGGGTKVAAELSRRSGEVVDRAAVYKWKTNGVPHKWRARIARLCRERGIPVPCGFPEFNTTDEAAA